MLHLHVHTVQASMCDYAYDKEQLTQMKYLLGVYSKQNK